jgi:hypothetical protein
MIAKQESTLRYTSQNLGTKKTEYLKGKARGVVVPGSTIFVTLMRKALSSFETSILTRATRRNIPEDAILHVCLSIM